MVVCLVAPPDAHTSLALSHRLAAAAAGLFAGPCAAIAARTASAWGPFIQGTVSSRAAGAGGEHNGAATGKRGEVGDVEGAFSTVVVVAVGGALL